ncbi:16S rRNA (guanine(966)-N(2))-methyltransferase RsmD [Acetobacter sp. AN02]|uniref:16S rRNA (guanine(966)-N(2))-methyltransferase RsmD n=1 Tax=Acetobacter sp. AN02 TaxID=2894186 RepID=UPI002434458E|nr:16S rRNA (guanine(966)-N(2))-methyltransferase RsmD [Acetobacter sp. AN02]MDG6093842.1 16S rRNA (guanine(966)-N(2))-methyltransferase RsmD [Acetobacter sp. AN02]
MRIIGGERRGRLLTAPPGQTTRPTADRVRQALFDMLLHAPWGGRDLLDGVQVLDAFAGTGALGLESLSRGAAFCRFFETDRSALHALRSNIADCRMEERSRVTSADVTKAARTDTPASLIFLDPPYRRNLPALALTALHRGGWIAPDALIVAETAADEPCPVDEQRLLAGRRHGAAHLWIWREN